MNKWIMRNPNIKRRGPAHSKPPLDVYFPEASELDALTSDEKNLLLEVLIRPIAEKIEPEMFQPFEETENHLAQVRETMEMAGVEKTDDELKELVTRQIAKKEAKRKEALKPEERGTFVEFKPQFDRPTELTITMEQILAELNSQKQSAEKKESGEDNVEAKLEAAAGIDNAELVNAGGGTSEPTEDNESKPRRRRGGR